MLQRLWAQFRDYVVLAVLLGLSLFILLNENEPFFRTTRAAALAVTGPVDRTLSWTGRYVGALARNEDLRAQNIALAAEVARLREAASESTRLRELVGFRESTELPLKAARVVSKDITRQDNLLTIDVGRADSVAVEMPVIDDRGLVGRVVLVSEHYALVMPHQNTDFRVPATIDLLQQEGIVRWDGRTFDRLLMEYVPKTEPVVRGQLVTTSPTSAVFPPGIPIGKVDSVFAAKGRNDLVIYLEPEAPIAKTDYVYVVLVEPDDERLALEAEGSAAPTRR